MLSTDLVEQRLDLSVVTVVDGDSDTGAPRCGHTRRCLVDGARRRRTRVAGATGHIDGATMAAQCVGDASPGTAACAGDDRDDGVIRH